MSDQAEKKKTDLLGRIDQFRADWEALLEEVGEARFERPGTAGDWTFRDVVAHLNGWRERTLLRHEAAHEGRDPAPPPWPVRRRASAPAGSAGGACRPRR